MTALMEISDVVGFKSIFNSIDALIDNLTFECYDDRVEINVIDGSRTVFMSCTLESHYFCEYRISEVDRYSIDVTEFKKILKSCKDELKILFDETCSIQSGAKLFKIGLLNDDFSVQKPSISRGAFEDAHVPVKFMKDTTKDVMMFANDVKITFKGNIVTFSTYGTMGNFSCEHLEEHEFDSSVESYYAIEKIKNSLGADKVSDEVMISMQQDSPLFLIFSGEGITVEFMIAPIIKEEGW